MTVKAFDICQCVSEVLNDTNLRRFAASERATNYDQELMAQYRLEFFNDSESSAMAKKKGNKKKKNIKCPLAVVGQRHSALTHIQALDKMLLLTIGIGLIAFVVAAGLTDEDLINEVLETGRMLPTLILHADEGSPAYSMNCFFAFLQRYAVHSCA